jgi:hypothetical protein
MVPSQFDKDVIVDPPPPLTVHVFKDFFLFSFLKLTLVLFLLISIYQNFTNAQN